MNKLYFVFEAVEGYARYELKGVYTQHKYEQYIGNLKTRAENNVRGRLQDESTKYVVDIPPNPDCSPDLEKSIKGLKKQSNELRLAGDFDAFIAINAQIRALNKIKKEKKQYEEAQRRCRLMNFNVSQIEERYEDMVREELNSLTRKTIVVTNNVEPRYDNCLTINFYTNGESFGSHFVENITFNTKIRVEEHPDYISVMRRLAEDSERYEDKIRSARKHYNACKLVLDATQENKDTLDYKKKFKRAVDAYYHLEQMNREANEIYAKNALKEVETKNKFSRLCVTRTVQIDVECDIMMRFSRSDINRFGTMHVFTNQNGSV